MLVNVEYMQIYLWLITHKLLWAHTQQRVLAVYLSAASFVFSDAETKNACTRSPEQRPLHIPHWNTVMSVAISAIQLPSRPPVKQKLPPPQYSSSDLNSPQFSQYSTLLVLQSTWWRNARKCKIGPSAIQLHLTFMNVRISNSIWTCLSIWQWHFWDALLTKPQSESGFY